MWERFSYYGMRALLIYYMIKGFMKLGDEAAYAIYGAYGALVYATPFIGGMLADRLLGARKALILGGLLMAAGHLLLTVEAKIPFFLALALIILGNGFFKPNVSTLVGSLYPKGSPKRDAGFTIFYMGVNLGAALAPLLCGYVGETFGWHYGFGLATVGMLIGVAIFAAPRVVTQALILGGALCTAGGMIAFGLDDPLMLAINAPVGIALLIAAFISAAAVGKGGIPDHIGRPPAHITGRAGEFLVYAGVLLAIPIVAIMVSNNAIAGIVLSVFGVAALATILIEAFRSTKIERERLIVVLVMMFFSMLFWAFFEQAGSSVSNFTDRNVNRVVSDQAFTPQQVGTTVTVPANQALVGLERPDGSIVRLTEIEEKISAFRELHKDDLIPTTDTPTIDWQVTQAHVGRPYGGTEIKASVFQAVNPICILTFGLLFSAGWTFLGKRGWEPNTAVKFAMGLAQLGLGFLVFWYAATQADPRGMTTMALLIVGYVLHTTGELCLSPVGLSMVTKLSPARIVSTIMGAWFLATAFSNYLAGFIAALTGVSEEGESAAKILPPPQETVMVYGEVFQKIGFAAIIAGIVLLIMSPLLTRWTHADKETNAGNNPAGH
jgi:POT family proton-dependent oligopeptide transporter